MGQLDVTFITVVNTVTALSSLQIDIRHLRILTHMLPEHLPLIMAQVNAMNMMASTQASMSRMNTHDQP